MTEKEYCDPKAFPITTQKGYSYEQQHEFDIENYNATIDNLKHFMLAETTRNHGGPPFREFCVKLQVPATPQLEAEMGFPSGTLKPYDENVMGLDINSYNNQATGYGKSTVFYWLIAGVITNIVDGKLFSLSTLLLLIPGVFIASGLALPLFWLKRKKVLMLTNSKSVVLLLLFTLTTALEVAVPVLAAIMFVKLIG